MKLITVTKAAERLGVHRQTVENWAKRGILQVKAVGRAHFVLEEEVSAIADIAPDVERARQSITKELDDIKAMQQEQEANRRAANYKLVDRLRADFYLLPSGERIHPVTMWHRHKTRAWAFLQRQYPGIVRVRDGEQLKFVKYL